MQERGGVLKAAQKLLGHKTDRITNRVYTHTYDTTLDDIADSFGQLFEDELEESATC